MTIPPSPTPALVAPSPDWKAEERLAVIAALVSAPINPRKADYEKELWALKGKIELIVNETPLSLEAHRWHLLDGLTLAPLAGEKPTQGLHWKEYKHATVRTYLVNGDDPMVLGEAYWANPFGLDGKGCKHVYGWQAKGAPVAPNLCISLDEAQRQCCERVRTQLENHETE